jgi:hypothetical protein
LYGPFEVGAGNIQSVSVEVLSSELENTEDGPTGGDVSVIVKGQADLVVFRRNYPTLVGMTRKIYPVPVTVPGMATLLLILSDVEPTQPGDGVTGQYFCFDQQGLFVAVTGIIPSECNWGTTGLPIMKGGLHDMEDCFVESWQWEDHVGVVYKYPLILSGMWEECSPRPSRVEFRVNTDIETARNVRKGLWPKGSAVDLYQRAKQDTAIRKTILVTGDSEIQFLGATCNDGWWLNVVIDGQEGFVTGLESFRRLGLQPYD